MKIWLDDTRPAPDGWTRAYWPLEVFGLLEQHGDQVTDLSLDHDLGDDAHGTGYDVLAWIECKVATENYRAPINITVHSSNPAAIIRMEAALRAIRNLEQHNRINQGSSDGSNIG